MTKKAAKSKERDNYFKMSEIESDGIKSTHFVESEDESESNESENIKLIETRVQQVSIN